MPEAFARKVDQQTGYVDTLLDLLSHQGSGFAQRALLAAAFLQLEMAVAVYLAEVLRRHRPDGQPEQGRSVHAGDIELMLERCLQTVEGRELAGLQLDVGTWWSRFLGLRRNFHLIDAPKTLKGTIFQTVEEEEALSFERIGAVNVDVGGAGPKAKDIHSIAESFRALVERQRGSSEEF